MADFLRQQFQSSRIGLESFLRIGNIHWCGDRFQPSMVSGFGVAVDDLLQNTQGRFSFAHPVSENQAILIRDKLGINKLFFAVHEEPRLLVANYLVDLVRRGVPMEAVYSVPAGHVLDIDIANPRADLRPYFEMTERDESTSWEHLGGRIRQALELWFSRIAERFEDRRICVCLSGGLDSSLIAALARRYFGDVTAYTYGYAEHGQASEDAYYGERVSEFLGMGFRFVPASRQDILEALDDAICYGQDWRDFNVHCAIVNEIIARTIEQDWAKSGDGKSPLVLTGDLMNEFLADYSSVVCQGKEYYRLPRVQMKDLREALLRGLDAGDREVGIFARHGIDVVQPYGMILDGLLEVPSSYLESPRCKEHLVERVAGDLVPRFVLDRVKTRAQVGTSSAPTGVLPVLAENGYDGRWLQQRFCKLLGVEDGTFLRKFIRLGRYRFSSSFPDRRHQVDGYYAG